MPRGKWIIPDDYTENETEWVTVIMCVPNTIKWRGIVNGAMYNLTRGRNWDESTGIVKVAQVIGHRIWESMTMDCENNLQSIAGSLVSMDSKMPSRITLQEFIAGLGDATVGDVAQWIELATAIAGLLPNLNLELTPIEWVRMILDFKWRRNLLSAIKDLVTTEKIENFLQGGETVAEGAEAIDGWVDDVSDWAEVLLSGLGVSAEFAQAYALLRESFAAEGANENLALRNLNRVYNDVFVEGDAMSVTQQNTQIVNCGDGDCQVASESPVGGDDDGISYDNTENSENFPPEFGSLEGWLEYKCLASYAMLLNMAESLYQVYLTAYAQLPQDTIQVLTQAVYNLIKTSDFAFGGGWLYNASFYNSLVSWEAQLIANQLYEEEDLTPFDIFLDVREDMLSNQFEWACEIYKAETAAEIGVNLAARFYDVVNATSYPEEVKTWAIAIFGNMLSNAWLSIPFVEYENIAESDVQTGEGCAGCGSGCNIQEIDFGIGTIDSVSANVDSEAVGSDQAVSIRFDLESGQWPNFCGEGVTLLSITGDANITKYRIYDVNAVLIWNHSMPPDLPLASVGNFEAFDQNAPVEQFNIQITWER